MWSGPRNQKFLHAEMVCTLLYINVEINVISLRSKWQALPRKPWAMPISIDSVQLGWTG